MGAHECWYAGRQTRSAVGQLVTGSKNGVAMPPAAAEPSENAVALPNSRGCGSCPPCIACTCLVRAGRRRQQSSRTWTPESKSAPCSPRRFHFISMDLLRESEGQRNGRGPCGSALMPMRLIHDLSVMQMIPGKSYVCFELNIDSNESRGLADPECAGKLSVCRVYDHFNVFRKL